MGSLETKKQVYKYVCIIINSNEIRKHTALKKQLQYILLYYEHLGN